MSQNDPKKPETPRAEPEILPPERGGPGARARQSGGIFYDIRSGANGEGPFIRVTKISGFKLTMLVIVALAIAIALVLTFASLFVVAAVISAILAAIAIVVAWIRRVFR